MERTTFLNPSNSRGFHELAKCTCFIHSKCRKRPKRDNFYTRDILRLLMAKSKTTQAATANGFSLEFECEVLEAAQDKEEIGPFETADEAVRALRKT